MPHLLDYGLVDRIGLSENFGLYEITDQGQAILDYRDQYDELGSEEFEELIDQPDNQTKRIAYALGVRCGLRSEEITDARPADIVDSEAGEYIIVQEGRVTNVERRRSRANWRIRSRPLPSIGPSPEASPLLRRNPQTVARPPGRFDAGSKQRGKHSCGERRRSLGVSLDARPSPNLGNAAEGV